MSTMLVSGILNVREKKTFGEYKLEIIQGREGKIL